MKSNRLDASIAPSKLAFNSFILLTRPAAKPSSTPFSWPAPCMAAAAGAGAGAVAAGAAGSGAAASAVSEDHPGVVNTVRVRVRAEVAWAVVKVGGHVVGLGHGLGAARVHFGDLADVPPANFASEAASATIYFAGVHFVKISPFYFVSLNLMKSYVLFMKT